MLYESQQQVCGSCRVIACQGESKLVSTPFAANDRNDLSSDAPKLDKETSSLYRGIVGQRLHVVSTLAICVIRTKTVFNV